MKTRVLPKSVARHKPRMIDSIANIQKLNATDQYSDAYEMAKRITLSEKTTEKEKGEAHQIIVGMCRLKYISLPWVEIFEHDTKARQLGSSLLGFDSIYFVGEVMSKEVDALAAQARICYQQGFAQKEIEWYDKILEVLHDPKVQTLAKSNTKVATYVERRKMTTFFNKAGFFKRCGEVWKKEKNIPQFLKCMNFAKKEYRRAQDIYEKHFETLADPALQMISTSYLSLVEVLKALHEYEGIPLLLNKVIKAPAFSKAQKAQAHFMMAELAAQGEIELDKKTVLDHFNQAKTLGYKHAGDYAIAYQAVCALNENQYEEAIQLFKQVEDSKSIHIRLQAINGISLAYYSQKQWDLALEYAEKCVKMFKAIRQQKPVKMDAVVYVVNSAGNAALWLDGESESTVAADRKKSLEYYQLVCELDPKGRFPQNHYNLAYKYMHGEGTDVDKKKALAHYQIAAQSGVVQYQYELAMMLVEWPEYRDIPRAISLLEAAAEQGFGKAVGALGIYHMSEIRVFFKEEGAVAKEKLSTPDYGKAQRYLEQATELGEPAGRYNLMALFLNGHLKETPGSTGSMKICLEEAEKMYLEILRNNTELTIRDKKKVQENLAIVYQQMLSVVDSPAEIDAVARKMVDVLKLIEAARFVRLVSDIDLSKREEAVQKLKALPLEIHCMSVADNKKIVAVAGEKRLTPQARIQEILAEVDLETVAPIPLGTAIHRLGRLTEESRKDRAFHAEQLSDVCFLLFEATRRLRDEKQEFPLRTTVNIVEGASKLYLSAGVGSHQECLEVFYRHAVAVQGQLLQKGIEPGLRDCVTLIFSATRLDPSLAFLKEVLPVLVERAFGALEKEAAPDEQSMANLVYALALLAHVGLDYHAIHGFKPFIAQVQKQFTAASTPERESLDQVYRALFYFQSQCPELGIEATVLTAWEKRLSQEIPVEGSEFQEKVTSLVDEYYDNVEVEAVVGVVKVDAIVHQGEQAKILQVEGPTHYLHGQSSDVPVPTMKTRFRDWYTQKVSGKETVHTHYYAWRDEETEAARKDAIAKIVGFPMPTYTWQRASGRSSSSWDPRAFGSKGGAGRGKGVADEKSDGDVKNPSFLGTSST